jgi:hypothetical protein
MGPATSEWWLCPFVTAGKTTVACPTKLSFDFLNYITFDYLPDIADIAGVRDTNSRQRYQLTTKANEATVVEINYWQYFDCSCKNALRTAILMNF